jgi:hypothetical protein
LGKKAARSVTDKATGITVQVSEDQKSLIATDKAGKEIWKARLIPDDDHVIERISILDGTVGVLGNRINLATPAWSVDLKTGEILKKETLE